MELDKEALDLIAAKKKLVRPSKIDSDGELVPISEDTETFLILMERKPELINAMAKLVKKKSTAFERLRQEAAELHSVDCNTQIDAIEVKLTEFNNAIELIGSKVEATSEIAELKETISLGVEALLHKQETLEYESIYANHYLNEMTETLGPSELKQIKQWSSIIIGYK